MKRLILLILIVGLFAFAGFVTIDDRHERWSDHAPRYGHREHPKAKTKAKTKKAAEPKHATTDESAPRIRKIVGRVSATEQRARADASRELEAEVSRWLEPDVPASWGPRPPTAVVDVKITPIEKPYGTVYTAEFDADFSDAHRAEIVRSYHRDAARDRMLKLGGLLAFALACLAVVSAYIRADEATKGYQTTRLRLLAAAGVAAAGALIYQLLA